MNYSVNQLKVEWVTTKGIVLEDFLLLAMHVLEKNRTEFFREADPNLTEDQHTKLIALLEQRAQSEPVAYLLGKKEFFGRDFLVNHHTLIPRPDSEGMIEDVIEYYKNSIQKPNLIFDIGTGSGALAITLYEELKNLSSGVRFVASDISPQALIVAEKNADIHNADITFLEGSLLEPYKEFLSSENFIYIVANLPYVSPALLQKTAPDVQNYEPMTALLSADQGLSHYMQLFDEIKKCDVLRGFCWVEISPEQSDLLTEKIKQILPAAEIFIGQDLAQRDRFVRFSI